MAGESAEQLIINRLAQAPSFHPSGAKLFVPDWTLDPGDVVTVQSDGEDYAVPIYSLDLSWNGACRADIQSTGNQKREPLSALRRKEFSSGRRGYGRQQELENEFKEFETWQTQTDETIGTYAAQFVEILGEDGNPGRLTLAETAIEQTASDATITAQAAGILLDADGHPILDARGKYQYDPNAADTTLIAQINTNATEILAKVSQSDLNTTLASYLQINAFSTELASTLDNGDTTLAAKIITAVNKNTNTSSVVISADQINLDGVVTAVFLDSRMADIESLFATTGYAGCLYIGSNENGTSISANGAINGLSVSGGTVTAGTLKLIADNEGNTETYTGKTVKIANSTLQNLWLLGTGSASSLDIPDAVTDVQISGPTNNVYKLQKKTLSNNSWQDCNVTFSRATSLNGTWSGSTYNIAATPQGNNWSIDFNAQSSSNATWATELGAGTVNSGNEKWLDFPIYIGSYNPSGPMTHNVTINKSIDASAVWQKGFEAGGGGSGGDYYATFLDNITLESTDIGDSVTKYSVANYSDGHRDSAANTRVVIDASKVYSAGVTAGLGGVVDVVKQPWNGNTCEFIPSAGEGASASVTITEVPTKVLLANATSTAEVVIKDGNNTVQTKNYYLRSRTYDGQNYVVLTDSSSVVSLGTVLAKYSASGGGGDTRAVDHISNIVLNPADIGNDVTKYPTLYYDDQTDDNSIPVYIDASAVYQRGQQDGSGLTILDQYSTTIDSNNATITLLPSDKGNYNVMASANVRIQVPVHEGVQGATLLASTDSDSAWSGWQLNDYTTLSKKYGFIRITGKDGSTYSYGVDANGVYDAGVSAGAGVQIETSKSYGSTVTETGTYTINPSSGYDAMRRATFSVRVPTVPRIQSTLAYGTASMGSHTVYPDEDYDAMQRVTFTVPNVTVETQRNQPTTGVTTTNIKVGNNIKVIVKFGNATVHQQIFAATT